MRFFRNIAIGSLVKNRITGTEYRVIENGFVTGKGNILTLAEQGTSIEPAPCITLGPDEEIGRLYKVLAFADDKTNFEEEGFEVQLAENKIFLRGNEIAKAGDKFRLLQILGYLPGSIILSAVTKNGDFAVLKYQPVRDAFLTIGSIEGQPFEVRTVKFRAAILVSAYFKAPEEKNEAGEVIEQPAWAGRTFDLFVTEKSAIFANEEEVLCDPETSVVCTGISDAVVRHLNGQPEEHFIVCCSDDMTARFKLPGPAKASTCTDKGLLIFGENYIARYECGGVDVAKVDTAPLFADGALYLVTEEGDTWYLGSPDGKIWAEKRTARRDRGAIFSLEKIQ